MNSTQIPIRILLVEDDEQVQVLIEEFLTDAGYEVDTATTVAQACSLLASRKYNLVLTDGRLPNGTGLTIAEKAHEIGIKSIMLTGYGDEFEPLRPDYLSILHKPIRLRNLLQEIEDSLKA